MDLPNADHALVASVMALFLSVDSVEVWSGHWNAVVDEAARVLSLVGIAASHKQKAVASGGNAQVQFAVQLDLKKHRGTMRAVYLLSVFRALCSVLRQVRN